MEDFLMNHLMNFSFAEILCLFLVFKVNKSIEELTTAINNIKTGTELLKKIAEQNEKIFTAINFLRLKRGVDIDES